MTLRGLVLLGCGGHARSAADIALAAGIERLLFVDPAARPGETMLGFDVVPALSALPQGWGWLPAVGDNAHRERLLRQGYATPAATLVAPGSRIGTGAVVGDGVLVGRLCHVGPLAVVGDGTIVNNGAVVEHDVQVGRCGHVSVNATLAGRVVLGPRVFVGAGATVIDGIRVGADVVIGAGATVVADLEGPGTYVGTPARRLAP